MGSVGRLVDCGPGTVVFETEGRSGWFFDGRNGRLRTWIIGRPPLIYPVPGRANTPPFPALATIRKSAGRKSSL